jgi:DNA-directed RNA polymerase specialized sigma24 family protein
MPTRRTKRRFVPHDLPVGPLDEAGASDRELLERFTTRQDATALAVLVWRYGPMVQSVCRGILSEEHDAADAFQTTFEVLRNEAASIGKPEFLRTWLHRVASRIAQGLDPNLSPVPL